MPRSLGGVEADPATAGRIVEEVAYADGSAGWCVMLAAQSAAFAGFLEEASAQEIWGHGGIVAGTARPIGKAIPASAPEDGFVISGTWPFASGSRHADWFAAECTIYDGDETRKDEQGNDVTRLLLVPREQVTIHDTWHTSGLRGTSSNDFSIDGAFAPGRRGFQVMVTPPMHPWGLYQAFPLIFMNHGSHAIGIARHALEAAREAVGGKTGWGGVPVRDTGRAQEAIAQATAQVESARTYLYETTGKLWDAVEAGDAENGLLRSRTRLAASHAASASLQAVDLLHRTLGTTPLFSGSPVEREFRDIHAAAAHVMVGPLTYEAAGRVELGMEAAFPLF
ncbi:MAG: hypothetical protein U5Q44_10220 [Dehalococcoidia bacterium]|nr:hypothetical protein [Dehalococcoidia bacterium]